MKSTVFGFLFLMFCAFSVPSEAQFFKKLADEVSDRVENKVINDAGDASVKGVDKAEKGTAKAVKKDGKKQKKKSRKRQKQDSKESSARSVPMEQSQDKEDPLPDNYKLEFTGSGSGYYLKYRMQMDMDQSSGFSMDMNTEMYVSPANGARSQTNMKMPMVGNISMAVLTDFDDPKHIIMLNERKKTYSIMDLDEMDDDKKEDFKVTNLGKETVHGLTCTHAKVTSEDGSEFDIWTTKEIPGFEKMMQLYFKTNKKMGGDQMWEALKKADAVGFMVKLLMETDGNKVVMELTEMKKMTVSKEMLQVPSNYKETKMKLGGFMNR